MHVGAVTCHLQVHHAGSIKDKRRVVKSIIARLRQRFGASAAEVGDNARLGHAQVGFSFVSSDLKTLRSAIDRAIEFVETADPSSELVRCETDIWTFDSD